MRDQQVGHLLEELALLELQLSRSRQVTQLCATVVRDSTGDIVRTTNILDVVKLDPQAMPILGKAICEMAVRRGLLEKLDEGRIEIAAPGSYELVYRPDQGGSIPFLHVDEDASPTEGALSLRSRELLQMTAQCMNGALAARYKDPSTGEILLPILPDRKAILVGEAGLNTEDLEQVIGKAFFPISLIRGSRGIRFGCANTKRVECSRNQLYLRLRHSLGSSVTRFCELARRSQIVYLA